MSGEALKSSIAGVGAGILAVREVFVTGRASVAALMAFLAGVNLVFALYAWRNDARQGYARGR